MNNLIQFTPCGALIVCILAWIRIVMLSHKIDQLEKTISLLNSEVDNQLLKLWHETSRNQLNIEDLILKKEDKSCVF